ncbi:MAG: NUDIX hydrolase [Candidatus Woesearchaeota archaeon]|jgi:ADP-ribose pyrophosphatase YjhB (NUDIX family)|nr:NUDIX hydrolase [Candidatus Woesearchaeota archaeon]
MLKKFFKKPGYELFPKILAVDAIITNEEDEILLKIRTKEPDKRKWEIIAGYVHPEETLNDALIRVTERKIGTKELKNIEFTGKYYDKIGRHINKNSISLIFTANLKKNQIIEDSTIKWFSKTVIPSLDLALDNKQVLEDYLEYSKKN